MDASNNLSNEVVRIIRVVDTTAPTLQLIGSNPITHELDEYFPDIDPGANWTDSYDGSGTVYSDATFSGTGSTKIKYTYVDSSGNTGSISRTVNVIDTIAPSLGLYSRNTTFSAHKFLLEGNAYSAETIRVTG